MNLYAVQSQTAFTQVFFAFGQCSPFQLGTSTCADKDRSSSMPASRQACRKMGHTSGQHLLIGLL